MVANPKWLDDARAADWRDSLKYDGRKPEPPYETTLEQNHPNGGEIKWDGRIIKEEDIDALNSILNNILSFCNNEIASLKDDKLRCDTQDEINCLNRGIGAIERIRAGINQQNNFI